MTPIELIVGFVLSIAANFATTAVQPPIKSIFQKKFEEASNDEDALRKALYSVYSLRDEVRDACKGLSLNLHMLGVREEEKPLWLLLGDSRFQDDLTEWLMAGAIEEGSEAKDRLIRSMEKALSQNSTDFKQIENLRVQYFMALDRAIFANPVLAHWRHQLSLNYLREQVVAARIAAEKAAGIYSSDQRKLVLDRYCEKALNAWDIIDLSNLPEGDIHIVMQKLLLRQLYMPLRITIEVGREQGNDDQAFAVLEEFREDRRLWEASRSTNETRYPLQRSRWSIGERLAITRRLVVLGDPGGGKTTMLRWIATAYLLRYRGDPVHHHLPDVQTLPERCWIPVLIRCRDLGEADLCRSFPDFLSQHLQKSELLPEEADIMKAVILDGIAKGETLLLVDGLDEITNPQVRMLFCQELERTAIRYPEAHIVVTSRIVGYRDMPYRMGTGFEHTMISELSAQDKDLFAQNWIEVIEHHQVSTERTKRAQELIDALHSSDRIERLTGNPMLLTTLALVKRKVGKLPSRRNKLYAEAVSVLLNWNPRYYETIDEDEAIPQLEFLAYEMCRRGVQRLTEDEVLDLLDKVRQEYPNVRAIRRREPHIFLELLEARSSILIKSGGNWLKQQDKEQPIWEFRHLTFQEYLASRAILDGRYPNRDRKRTLAEQVAPLAGSMKLGNRFVELEVVESWQEVLRLLVADCKDDDVDDVVRAIATPLPDENVRNTTKPRIVLAARCLADEPNVDAKSVEEVLSKFASQISYRDGSNEKTILDKAALELGKSHWRLLLKHCLIKEFQNREPSDGWNVGSLCGMVEMVDAPQSVKEFEIWFSDLSKRLDLDDEIEVISATLTIMNAAYEGKALIVPGLIDSLLSLLSHSPLLRFTTSWVLYWLSRGSPVKKKSIWVPSGNEVQTLMMALESTPSSENDSRSWLTTVLGFSRDPSIMKLLVSLLTDSELKVRIVAAEELGNLGDKRAVEPLIALLTNHDADVREAAAKALGNLGDKRAVEPLIAVLGDPLVAPETVAKILGNLGDKRAVEPLIALLTNHDADVREAAAEALGNLGDKRAIEPLIALLTNLAAEIRGIAVKALGNLGDKRAVAPLLELISDVDLYVRANTAMALTQLNHQQGLAIMKQMVQDAEFDVRIAMMTAFAKSRNGIEQQLLSVDLDGIDPWIDPQQPIIENDIVRASQNIGIAEEEVRSCYERLAFDIPLILDWVRKSTPNS